MVGRPRRRHVVDGSGRLHSVRRSHAPLPQRQSVESHKSTRTRVHLSPKTIAAAIAAIALVGILWVVVGSFITYGKVVDKSTAKKAPALNFLGNIRPNQLEGEGDGRVNVLLIGVGGAKHPGGNLADTVMVASFDPKNKEAALLSLPRDLYVPYDGKFSSKLNAVHSYGEQNGKKTGGGPALMKKTVSTMLDLPIHYYVRVDFTALEKIVDTLGGITVDVEKPIVDLSYPADNMIDYAPFRLNAGKQTLNGKTALKYARSRHASGSEGSDFARARRQQKTLAAIKDKALSLGVLGSPKKITELINILGDHVKTDIDLVESERFFQLWKDIDSEKIVSKVLDNGVDGPLVSSSGDERGYILLPRTGDFTEIQQIAHEIFADPYLREEKATISLINASGNTATGTQVMALLKKYGYKVTDVTPKGQAKAAKTKIADHTNDKPYTRKFLENRFKVNASSEPIKASKTSSPSPTVVNITITIGTDYKSPTIRTVKPANSTKPTTPSTSTQTTTPNATQTN